MRNVILFFLVLIAIETKAQWVLIDTSHVSESVIDGVYIPKDIEDCFLELSKPEYNEIRTLLLTIIENNIDRNFKGTVDFWHKWYFHEASRLTKYFNDLGIMYAKSMQDIILHTFYRKMHDSPIRFNEEIAKYKIIESHENEEYQKKLQLDSINFNISNIYA